MQGKLTPEQWHCVEVLYAQLSALPPEAREAYLLHTRREDAEVADELAAMLETMDSDSGFLEQPVRVSSIEAPPEPVPAGTCYGPWRILELLGRGGMGEVYRAERADGAYQQQVALKVLKRGLDTDAVLRRFLRERRILAQLKHPNIAYLIDAGATPGGLPYLVMEYVEGSPITQWCRQQRVPLRRMLELMCEVCRAVDAAHRRLVVHRDLKPSNVMIAADGSARLLDFGIAKLLDEPEGHTGLTAPGGTPATLQYAAPEQILELPVTTATDVYALGVLLYELLSGGLPRAHATRTAATLTATAARARRDEPVIRPSVALRRRAAGPDSPMVQAHEVEGDLDLIVLKCLQSDPERRYHSAQELSDDLHRFLQQRPILARPDSLRYRAGRFLRRNRLGVGATAAVLAVLVGGVTGIVLEARRAELQARRAEHVKDLALSVFRQQDPLAPSGSGLRTPAQMIAASLDRADQELRGDPDLHAELLDSLGEIQFNVGDTEGSAATLRRALREKEAYYGPDSREAAETLRKLTMPVEMLGHVAEARGYAQRALDILRRLGLGQTVDAARAEMRLGITSAAGNGAPQEAMALQIEATRIFEARLGADNAETIYAKVELAITEEQGRHDAEAEALLREAIDRYGKLYGPTSVWLSRPLATLARILARTDRPEEAETMYRRAIALSQPVLGPRHDALSSYFKSLGVLYAEKLGRFADAEAAFRAGVAALPDGDEGTRTELLKEAGRLHLQMRRADEAEPELHESFTLNRKLLGEDKGLTWYTGSEWGRALAAEGRLAEAEAIQRQALQKVAQLMGTDAYQNCLIQEALADTLEKKGGSLAEELILRRRALELTAKKYPETSRLWAQRASDLARALMAQDDAAARAEARRLLDRAAADYRAGSSPMDNAGQTLLLRAQLEAGGGESEAAVADLREALQKLGSQTVNDDAATQRAQVLLHRLKGA